MALEVPPRGAVFEYPYRWAEEAAQGASPDGRKDRTVCLILAVALSRARHVLYLLAVSSKAPREGQVAPRVSETERHRVGLNRYPEAWVYISEFNRDVAEESFYFEPHARRLGVFSPAFVLRVARELASKISLGTARSVDRGD
ncbi:MAG TPA: hypothetical protein VFC47_02710 [Caulobacteraceae bacterium]|nr:hypothetical protein [Caulobacteraceae bacterium]